MAIKRTAGTVWIASNSGPVVYEQAVEMTDRMIYFLERNEHCGHVMQVPAGALVTGTRVGGPFDLTFLGRSRAEARERLFSAVERSIEALKGKLDEECRLLRLVFKL